MQAAAEMGSKEALVAVVDDEASIRDAVSEVLNVGGFRSKSFESGLSFLEWVRDNKPDCVLIDVHMPEISGVEVLSKLNKMNFDLK